MPKDCGGYGNNYFIQPTLVPESTGMQSSCESMKYSHMSSLFHLSLVLPSTLLPESKTVLSTYQILLLGKYESNQPSSSNCPTLKSRPQNRTLNYSLIVSASIRLGSLQSSVSSLKNKSSFFLQIFTEHVLWEPLCWCWGKTVSKRDLTLPRTPHVLQGR